MDWLKVAAIVEIVTTGCTILLAVAVFWLRHSFVKHKEFTAAAKASGEAVDALRLRVSDCERRHEGTAKVADITAVTVRLTEIDGSVRTVTKTVDGMEKSMDKIGNAVDRIEQYLIERKL
ncbi:MAG TPA: hypothetical protein VGV37_26395 [Aliidongia sp.]|uniref:hypothetical protein n=1 Tax=Aliidongia sp. TaxID=1914230 RepID=UPI002DDD7153|nr:hypothetical protein [Aliidongia sp.]HEV2678087.1 hypothetical protein [Aliidongia sp.]